MEKVTKQLDQQQTDDDVSASMHERILWIIDFKDMVRTKGGRKAARQSSRLLQDHYPERLQWSFLVDPPFFMRLMIPLVRPFMDAKTKAKMVLLSGSKEIKATRLLQEIDEGQLEELYGGNLPPPQKEANEANENETSNDDDRGDGERVVNDATLNAKSSSTSDSNHHRVEDQLANVKDDMTDSESDDEEGEKDKAAMEGEMDEECDNWEALDDAMKTKKEEQRSH